MINPHPDAPEGQVCDLDEYSEADFAPTDVVLCRNSAPLITFAFGLIQRGVGVKVLGREIGQGLVTLVKKAKCKDIGELEMKLIQMRTRERAKALREGNESAAAAIEDKYDCLGIFVQNSETIDEVLATIVELFDEKRKGLLTLSTMHKAKGLEWRRVFILDWNLVPSRWAKQDWMQKQERNLQYVAVTRAKEELIFIYSGNWKEDRPALSPSVSAEPQPGQEEMTFSEEAETMHGNAAELYEENSN